MSVLYKGKFYLAKSDMVGIETPNETTNRIWLNAKLNSVLKPHQINMIYNMKKLNCSYGEQFEQLLKDKNIIV
jgi:hypothetical protein